MASSSCIRGWRRPHDDSIRYNLFIDENARDSYNHFILKGLTMIEWNIEFINDTTQKKNNFTKPKNVELYVGYYTSDGASINYPKRNSPLKKQFPFSLYM